MTRFVQIDTPEALARSAPPSHDAGVPPLTPEQFRREAPDAHWLLMADASLQARCSLWWTQVPALPGATVGCIGHYAATAATAGIALLHQAQAQLRQQGCTFAVGPMDGNTWRHYRLVSASPPLTLPGDGEPHQPEPPFFLEPQNPEAWNQHFLEAGWQPIATYSSALNTDLSQRDPRQDRVQIRLDRQGIRLRSLDLSQFDQELQRIHTLSCESFQHNFLYTPIALTAFSQHYAKIQPYVRPEFVWLAEQPAATSGNREPELVGFLFAIPDWLAVARSGGDPTTLIIKTVAVKPGRSYAGLGSFLVDRVQAIAHQQGYTRAIHALMYDQNPSRHISDRFARPMRHYTLYGTRV